MTADLRKMGSAVVVALSGSESGSVLSIPFGATDFDVAGEYILTAKGVLGVLTVKQSVRIRVREVA